MKHNAHLNAQCTIATRVKLIIYVQCIDKSVIIKHCDSETTHTSHLIKTRVNRSDDLIDDKAQSEDKDMKA